MKKALILAAAGALALSACGGDDGDSAEDRIVEALGNLAEEFGGSIDESCVRANMVGLSDSDLEEIASALEEEREAEGLSAEADQAGEDVGNCITIDE